MAVLHYLQDEIAIVGWSCRLPGADSIAGLWSLLLEGRCAVSQVPAERFPLERFGHPRRGERGKSYTWAAGVLNDVWGFDPEVFGISPREAEQMDPQQRILLQLTWEALESAGIRPSAIAGSDIGVFVGASSAEYSNASYADPAIVGTHFATGNALAILANRISYIFDLHGPSFTIDTACSSSLVALHQAAEAIRSGRVDTAIVGGVNVIASHTAFVSFSQASMLSPTGLCRAFDAKADGYVRSEGGAVLVLRKAQLASAERNPIRGTILASDVNSDGRTNGISLPSVDAQERLLKRVYSRAGIAASRLAFVEAHGTGTAVGDPIEATAIGQSLGHDRGEKLLIGSVKTNIGHLEPASGIVGVIKAQLALNHGMLPPSLHYSEPNPHIDFKRLNLAVNHELQLLPTLKDPCAGVNSFGFGGTNAHVVIAPGRKPATEPGLGKPARFLTISAETKPALVALAQKYAGAIAGLSGKEVAAVASAARYRRDQLATGLAVSTLDKAALGAALNAFVASAPHHSLASGSLVGRNLKTAFVYSGNGSQWAGMGVAAFEQSAAFRERFLQIDAYFQTLAGWSLKDALFSPELAVSIDRTSIAQPLIFAIQSAATVALGAGGLRPAVVLGHSVGEVAAAEAAGILDMHSAIQVIFYRSKHQETLRGTGRMAVIVAPLTVAERFVASVEGLEIAAINSARAITLAGSNRAIDRLKNLAGAESVAFVDLGLDYPFHSELMAPIESELKSDLSDLVAVESEIPFVSTVTGSFLSGLSLSGDYWWRNIRQPVQFFAAIREAAKLGARCFIEIGPSSVLQKHVSDGLAGELAAAAVFGVLSRKGEDNDPFDAAVAKALVAGAQIDEAAIFGADPGGAIALPSYPWQQQNFRYAPSTEAIGVSESHRHPLAGARPDADALEWRSQIDTIRLPALVDHKVGERIILPATGFLEIALSVASQWLNTETVSLANFEILRPLDLTGGEVREVMTRVSPGSNTFEIMSRPRFSRAGWMMNCSGKMMSGTSSTRKAVRDAKARVIADSAALYAEASAAGLHYGPAFRQLESVSEGKDGRLHVKLTASDTVTGFLLDPARMDCCVQGVIAAFAGLHAIERGVSYIPVRFDEAVLYVPGAIPHAAAIEILVRNDRAIVGNADILAADGAVIATIRGMRCQAFPVKKNCTLDSVGLVELLRPVDGRTTGVTGVAADADEIAASAQAMGATDAALPDEGSRLLEGWAMAAAYEIAQGLGGGGKFDLERVAQARDLPQSAKAWLLNLMRGLEKAGLANETDGGWEPLKGAEIPASQLVVKALAGEFPERAAEILLAAEFSRLAGSPVLAPFFAASPAALGFLQTARAAHDEGGRLIARLLQDGKTFDGGRAVRILQLGAGGFPQQVEALLNDGLVLLTIFEPDKARFDRAQARRAASRGVTWLAASDLQQLGEYDIIVAADTLHRFPREFSLARICQLLAPNGLLIALEPQPSLFKDLALGTAENWFADAETGYPLGPLRNAAEWQAAAAQSGFVQARTAIVRCGAELMTLMGAKAGPARPALASGDLQSAERKMVLALGDANLGDHGLSAALAAAFGDLGIPAVSVPAGDLAAELAGQPAATVVHFVRSGAGTEMDRLSAQCLGIKQLVESLGNPKARVWLVFAGAQASSGGPIDPVAAGAWAFSRTVANEFPNLDLRRMDIAAGADDTKAAAQLRDTILSATPETELHFDGTTVRGVRADSIQKAEMPTSAERSDGMRLQRRAGSAQRLQWEAADRVCPGDNDVEIAVEAVGLNFRDLMWMLSLLPDDILEDGFTGPSLGLECAGKVLRVGAAVKDIKAGDRVVALAAASFATHVTVPGGQVFKLPDHMPAEAAVTIPVAFITAYYSLVTMARLKRGEWVLIHGAAGGVGMAALQIAQAKGAHIIATAGSPAKRALLKILGVRHVLDSRSTDFADGVRKIVPGGVDVVLNSLAGEAMERSVACLRSFGRFVELGKRDYVLNTHLGLRPFRKNLSYFGVDIDQLVGKRGGARGLFSDVMRRFADGRFAPLPHTVFDAEDVADAFHLMQQSAHIGKIVVRPPRRGTPRIVRPRFAVVPDRTHLVTGGFGGFGLEAASWLADNGARHIVLVGRRGPADEAARQAVDALAARGVQVRQALCDIADPAAVETLFADIGAAMPPLAGVLHAAMVLDDTTLANLDEERMRRVLQPKVAGAELLDRLTQGMTLDYFVLFSSVTTLIGNPGQGSYVAANAYMEGLARRRRQQGLPALAPGWGPISDVGVLARNQKLAAALEKAMGMRGMTAREALELMREALEREPGARDLAAVTLAPHDGTFGGGRLAVMRSPTYSALAGKGGDAGDAATARMDLKALVMTEDAVVVRRMVSEALSRQLAQVLHSRPEDISQTRVLADMGLDSLMALELGMNLEDVFSIQISLGGAAGGLSVAALTEEIIAQASGERRSTDSAITAMVERHAEGRDPRQLERAHEILGADETSQRSSVA